MQPEEGNNKLREVDEYYRNDIELLINGAKLKRKEEPANIKTLKDEITGIIKGIAGDGNAGKFEWVPLRTCIIFRLRDVLDSFNAKSKDSPTFADELDIIMQYFVQFERPPFTIQRICELIVDPDRYYNSTKKLLYAFEKLVNVCEPEERV